MSKSATYHESAVIYNETLAECAKSLSESLEDPEVSKWCAAIGRQHDFHAGRHRRALNRLAASNEAETDQPESALADVETKENSK